LQTALTPEAHLAEGEWRHCYTEKTPTFHENHFQNQEATFSVLGRVLRGCVELPLAGVHFFPMLTNTFVYVFELCKSEPKRPALRCHAGQSLSESFWYAGSVNLIVLISNYINNNNRNNINRCVVVTITVASYVILQIMVRISVLSSSCGFV
jgi:hypothetical protein